MLTYVWTFAERRWYQLTRRISGGNEEQRGRDKSIAQRIAKTLEDEEGREGEGISHKGEKREQERGTKMI